MNPASRIVIALSCVVSLGACSVAPLSGDPSVNASAGPAVPVPQKAQVRFDDGLRAMEAQQWNEALPVMEIVWQRYPQYSGPALNAALIHQREGRPEEAETWFLRALQANSDNLEARNSYGIFLREQGRYREAEEQYRAALATREEHATSHYNMGILCDLYLGDKARALEHFSRYLEIAEEQNRQVTGWVADLRRQVARGKEGAS